MATTTKAKKSTKAQAEAPKGEKKAKAPKAPKFDIRWGLTPAEHGKARIQWEAETAHGAYILSREIYGDELFYIGVHKDTDGERFVELKNNGKDGNHPKQYPSVQACLDAIDRHYLKAAGRDADLAGIKTNREALLEACSDLFTAPAPEKKAKAPKEEKKGEGGEEKVRAKGARYELFGHAITAIFRRLGKEGWAAKDAMTAVKKLGVECSPATAQIQVKAGAKGERGEPAPLTKEQLKELKAAVN